MTTNDKRIVTDYEARNSSLSEGNINYLASALENVKNEYGALPKKFIEIGEINFVPPLQIYKPRPHFRQIFYHYTDKNPEGVES